MKTIVFVYENIVMGGIYSLIENFSLQLNGITTIVYYKNIDKKIKEKISDKNIILIKYNTSKDILNNNYNTYIFFEIDEFLSCLHKCKDKSKGLFLYVVHPNLFSDYEGSVPLYKKMIFSSLKNCVKQYIYSGRVFFMDYECLESTLKYYNFCIEEEKKKQCIVHLISNPVSVPIKAFNKQRFDILSVSRADFPFKGYLIGLIDEYNKIRSKYDNVCLTVVSTGPNIVELKKKIDESKFDINLIQGLSRDELSAYYNKCDLYVGMGMTIIEASSRGKISLPVKTYTYKCLTNGFFYNNPEWVTADIGMPICISRFVEELLNDNIEALYNKQIKTIKAINDNYSANTVVKELYEKFNSLNTNNCVFPFVAFYLKIIRNIIKRREIR